MINLRRSIEQFSLLILTTSMPFDSWAVYVELRDHLMRGIALLLKALQQSPNDKDALYNLANLYMDSSRHEEA